MSKIPWVYNSTLQTDPYECYYCGHPMKVRGRTREHIVPKSHGGTNGELNLVYVHSKCNLARGSKTLIELLGKLPDGFIRSRVETLQAYIVANKSHLMGTTPVGTPKPIVVMLESSKPPFRWEDYLGGGYFHID